MSWTRRTGQSAPGAGAKQRAGSTRSSACAAVARAAGSERGFTLIEVLVGAVVLIVGLAALLGMIVVASHASLTNRVRQAGTSLGREVVEDIRSLPYVALTPSSTSLAAELQPLVSGSTVAGSTLTVTRSAYTFSVSFSACSLDDPSDGYGSHTASPASGGSWCPDVAAAGTADTQPDDEKRVVVTLTPTGPHNTPTIQQSVMIYNHPTHGPAVSCLTTPTGSCPGANFTVSDSTVSSLTFDVTTTTQAAAIQWLVNGNRPSAAQDTTGANGTYTPSGTTSSFVWTLPRTTDGNYTIDGTYAITAVAYDANGNAGTRSTVQVTVNEHPVIAPASLNAGFDRLIGGVDVQWIPSVDQDVLYYDVYRQTAGGPVQVCTNVTGTSCSDMTATAPPAPPNPCTSFSQSYTTPSQYYVIGVDTDPNTGQPRLSTMQSPQSDANICDHQPSAPSGLTGSLSNGALNLSWTAPAAPGDADPSDKIFQWRIYRWTGVAGVFPGVSGRLQLVGALDALNNYVTTASDSSPDPGGFQQNYCVTSVDMHLNESPCSNTFTG